MATDSGTLPPADDAIFQRAVLEFVLEIHPEHLTPEELVLKMASDPDRPEEEQVRLAIRDLKRSGLFRPGEGVVVNLMPGKFDSIPTRNWSQLATSMLRCTTKEVVLRLASRQFQRPTRSERLCRPN